MTLNNENAEAIFTLKNNIIHKYYYNQNNIYFIDIENNIEEKYITLCNSIDNCVFEVSDNKLNVSINIGEITYNNIFNIFVN